MGFWIGTGFGSGNVWTLTNVADGSANSSYITARAEQSSIRIGPKVTGGKRHGDKYDGSAESESEGSKDTDNSHYPSSLSDDGNGAQNALPSPETTPEQPEERRRMAVVIAMDLPIQHLTSDPGPSRSGQVCVLPDQQVKG